jgi:hypothetical protein
MALTKPWSPYRQIIIQTREGPSRGHHGSVRAHPVAGQGYPTTTKVSCSKAMRELHKIGTKFRVYAREISREGGPLFLYTGPDWPYEIVE